MTKTKKKDMKLVRVDARLLEQVKDEFTKTVETLCGSSSEFFNVTYTNAINFTLRMIMMRDKNKVREMLLDLGSTHTLMTVRYIVEGLYGEKLDITVDGERVVVSRPGGDKGISVEQGDHPHMKHSENFKHFWANEQLYGTFPRKEERN